MLKDMHFYGTYCIARAAGVGSESAYTIAFASQFVNDAINDQLFVLNDKTCIYPLITSHTPYDYVQNKTNTAMETWVSFHFLPGNEPADGTFIQRMICRKNSIVSQEVVKNALDLKNKQYWPYLIGITAHVYADTFSHFGFVGIPHEYNKVEPDSIKTDTAHSKGITKYIKMKLDDFKTKYPQGYENFLPIGHGMVSTCPDRPYLKWGYKNTSLSKFENRNNTECFMEACECLYYFFNEYIKKSPEDKDSAGARKWEEIAPTIRFILGVEMPLDQRISLWLKNLKQGKFNTVSFQDQTLFYDKDLWMPKRAVWESEEKNIGIEKTHVASFIKAARLHKNYVLYELLPKTGIII